MSATVSRPPRRRGLTAVAALTLALSASGLAAGDAARAAELASPTIVPAPAPMTWWGIGDTPLVPLDRPLVSNPHSGTVGDPTNPEFELRVAQTGSDGAPVDPASLQVTARIAPNGNRISPFGEAPAADAVTVATGATPDLRRVAFSPVRIGNAKVIVTVTGQDGTTASYAIDYYASRAATPTSRFLHLTADASTAIDAGDGYLFVGGDENREIRLYDAQRSGLPVALFHPGHNPNDGPFSEGEDDFEASARTGDSVFWLGSQSTSRKGEVQASRHVVYETTIAGSGKDATLTRVGAYGGLRRDLIAWDNANGRRYGFAAGSAAGLGPAEPDRFNIEGAEFAPDNTTLYLGFRAPLVGGRNGGDALIVPVKNIQQLTRGEATQATFGEPIELDFGGASIREMRRNAAGEYLILTNDIVKPPSTEEPPHATQPPTLWYWDGDPTSVPQRLNGDEPLPPNVTEVTASLGSWEAIGAMPDRLEPGRQVRLIMDQGYDHLYAAPHPNTNGEYYDAANKDNPTNAGATLAKSRTDLVTLTGTGFGYRLTATGLAPFSEQLPGTTSPPQTATLTNRGRKPVPIGELAVRGDDPGDFRLDPGSCAHATLQPDQSCTAAVRYAPTRGEATSTAQLQVTSDAPLPDRAFGLSGTSATGTFTAAPAPTIDVTAPRIGDRLTATVAAWSPAPELRHQWLRGGAPIPGSTDATYTATADDEGFALSVRVTGTAPGYERTTRTSGRTAAVVAAPTTPRDDLPAPPTGPLAPGGPLTPGGPPAPIVDGLAPTLQWKPVRSRYAIAVAARPGRRLLLTVRAPKTATAKIDRHVTVKIAGVRGSYRVTLKRGRATLKLGAKAGRLRTGTRATVTVTVPKLRYLVDRQPSGQQPHEVPTATKRVRVTIR